ncbi:MAG: phosphatase PAP2 family protein, partial [Patescibacteria group bacterium]
MSYVVNLDFLLTNLLSTLFPNNSFFNYFFSFFSLKGVFVIIWALIVLLLVFFEEKKNPGISRKDLKFVFLFSMSFLLTFFLADILLKNIFMRPRPILDTKYFILNTFSCPRDFSFPSAHAATAFAAATILAYFDKKRRWFYYIIAVLISYSRIYLGCHYFLDVVA